MIFECGPDGPDKKVCARFADMLWPEAEIKSVTLSDKKRLLVKCGEEAAVLLAAGCQRVLIVWDLHPAWREAKPCLHEDREAIFQSLRDAKVKSPNVHLVCIVEELESWLVADGRAISTVLSTPAHPVRVPHENRPDKVQNPKARLRRLFKQNGKGDYVDLLHAIKIAREITDLTRVRRSETFRRFALKLADKQL